MNNFYISIANKNTIEYKELNHPDTLDYFNLKNIDITYATGFRRGYTNSYAKNTR